MSILNIALLTDGIHPFTLGGIQKYSYYLIKYLAISGVNVTVFHPHVEVEEKQLMDLFEEKLHKYISLRPVRFPKHISYPAHYLVESYLYSKRIFEDLRNCNSFDFVYIQGYTGWYTLKHKSRMKMVTTGINFHGLNMFQPTFGFKNKVIASVLRLFAKKNMSRANCIFSLGGNLTFILNRAGFTNVVEVPIGIDSSWLEINKNRSGEKRKFIFVGRNDKIKSFDMIKDCFIDLLEKKMNIELHVVGPISPTNTENSAGIIYHGEIKDQNRLKEIFKQCNVVLCPSISEGMPTVILEGMSVGLAVLATNVGAIPLLVDESNGTLIQPGDKAALKNALIRYIEMNDQLLTKMGVASRKKIKDAFTWNSVAERHIQVIDEILLKNQ